MITIWLCLHRFGRWSQLWGMALAVWVATGLSIYWVTLDTRSPIIGQVVSAAVHDIVLPGESLRIFRTYCLAHDATFTTEPQFVDHIIYNLPTKQVFLPAGCHSSITQIDIPPHLPPGYYSYEVTLDHHNNPFINSHKRLPAVGFWVTNPDGSLPPPPPSTVIQGGP